MRPELETDDSVNDWVPTAIYYYEVPVAIARTVLASLKISCPAAELDADYPETVAAVLDPALKCCDIRPVPNQITDVVHCLTGTRIICSSGAFSG